GCLHPGADHQFIARSANPAASELSVHLSRPGNCVCDQPPRRGDVSWRTGGTRPHCIDLSSSLAPLYRGSGLRDTGSRSAGGACEGADCTRRGHTEPVESSARLPVSHSLSLPLRAVSRRETSVT